MFSTAKPPAILEHVTKYMASPNVRPADKMTFLRSSVCYYLSMDHSPSWCPHKRPPTCLEQWAGLAGLSLMQIDGTNTLRTTLLAAMEISKKENFAPSSFYDFTHEKRHEFIKPEACDLQLILFRKTRCIQLFEDHRHKSVDTSFLCGAYSEHRSICDLATGLPTKICRKRRYLWGAWETSREEILPYRENHMTKPSIHKDQFFMAPN